MFALSTAKAQTKVAASLPNKVAQQHSKPVPRAWGELQEQEADSLIDQARTPNRGSAPAMSWDFTKIPVFPPDRSTPPHIPTPLPRAIQPKLPVGQVNDPLEHEADRVAEQVMRMPIPEIRRGNECSEPQGLEASLPLVGTMGAMAHSSVEPIVGEALRVSGQPLDLVTRAFFEPRFGFDFSHVRIHSDRDAADSAFALGVEAYTVANHVVFDSRRHAMQPADGDRLLAHELTHVVQQHASAAPSIQTQKTSDEKENEERANLLKEFTDEAGIAQKQLGQIAAAMRGFSLHQLHAMRQAGVRFWSPNSLPPEFRDRVVIKNLSSPGGYWAEIRIIQMGGNASTDAIRHELAHAWDHVRSGKVKPIGQLKDKDFVEAVKNTPALSSATGEKRSTSETKEGKVRRVRLSIPEMFERYKKWKLREQSFDNPSTQENYSKSSPREFYAEGYSVFHGGREWNQARLLYYAPELYELLEAEAKQEGLDIPDRAKIEAARKEQNLPD